MILSSSDPDSTGKPHLAFEYLAAHEVKAKELKLQLKDGGGTVVQEIDLISSASRRASNHRGNFLSAADEWDAAIGNLADLAREIIDMVNARLANTPREERWIKRMAAALDLRVMAFPGCTAASARSTAAVSAATDVVSIGVVGLTFGDRIEVLVSDAGEQDLWWPACVGGPATGAGGHGVIIVYDAWTQQGHSDATTSRACLNSNSQTLLDVDEMATWRWRFTTPAAPPLVAPPPAPLVAARAPATVAADAATAAANASTVADAMAAAALNGADAALSAKRAEVLKLAAQVSTQGIAVRAAFDALLLLTEWMATRFAAAPLAALPAAPLAGPQANLAPRPMPTIVDLWAQRCLLQKRLEQAATTHPYDRQWPGVSGTVIMEAVYTQEKFYTVRRHHHHLRRLRPHFNCSRVTGLRRLSSPLQALRHKDIVRGRRRGHGLSLGHERYRAAARGVRVGGARRGRCVQRSAAAPPGGRRVRDSRTEHVLRGRARQVELHERGPTLPKCCLLGWQQGH